MQSIIAINHNMWKYVPAVAVNWKILHLSIFASQCAQTTRAPSATSPDEHWRVQPQRSSFEAPATLRYPITTTSQPPTPPTPPPTCSPAVSPLAAPAPSRRASRPSPRGVSPRPQRSMRSLLSLSSALTVPTPARWYVTAGYPRNEGIKMEEMGN